MARPKESLKKYFKDSQDIQHDDDTKKQLTIEEMYQSVDDEIKEQEKKLEELNGNNIINNSLLNSNLNWTKLCFRHTKRLKNLGVKELIQCLSRDFLKHQA